MSSLLFLVTLNRSARPAQEGLHFHRVEFADNALFSVPRLHSAARSENGRSGRSHSSIFFMFITRCHTHWPPVWPRRWWTLAPRIVTTLHGSDTTRLGQT